MNDMVDSRDRLTLARALLAEALDLAPEAVDEEVEAESLEAWDSLAHLRLVLAIEARSGRQLEPEEILAITSLAEIARLL